MRSKVCGYAERSQWWRRAKSVVAQSEVGCSAEKSQNISDIFRNSIEISTNSIEIFKNINDILSLFGAAAEFEARRGQVLSAHQRSWRRDVVKLIRHTNGVGDATKSAVDLEKQVGLHCYEVVAVNA
jgi:hypothetical protein